MASPGKQPLLLIDDDSAMAEMLAEYLEPEGYQLESANNAQAGLNKVRENSFALVILDVLLPDREGFAVLTEIRKARNVPVIMLSTRDSISDRVAGLEAGADDYIPKPFAPEELLARIHTVLRRARANPPHSAPLHLGDLRLDPAARTLYHDGAPVHTTTAEFEVLRLLLATPGEPILREQLTQAALGRETYPGDRGVDNLISSLRKKLGPAPDGSDRFRSVRNNGYIYVRPGSPDSSGVNP